MISVFVLVLAFVYLTLIYELYCYSRQYKTTGSEVSEEKLTASRAADIYANSVSKESIEKELKPVLKAVSAQSKKGFSEAATFSSKWRPENRNATRGAVILELESMGYKVYYWQYHQCLIIKW